MTFSHGSANYTYMATSTNKRKTIHHTIEKLQKDDKANTTSSFFFLSETKDVLIKKWIKTWEGW